MSEGLFSASDVKMSRSVPLLPQCGACGLYKTCQSPKMPVSGKGRKRILIVGEAPGENEDDKNLQFVGDSGQMLKKTLAKFGIDMRRDCWIDNALRCHPPKNEIKDKRAVDYCRPNIVQAVKELNPELILLFGAIPVRSLLGWIWRDEVGPIGRWINWRIPCQKLNAWVCPIWHPSFIIRTGYGVSGDKNDVRQTIFERHVKAALKCQGRPWKKVPDYKSQVMIVYDEKSVNKFIRGFVERGRPTAFDLETNQLKPDGDASRIHYASMSNGEMTIAFEWHSGVLDEFTKFLESSVPKIGANMKFEQRWLMRHGGRVRNWWWDTMIAAHVLDNRPGISSVKFQGFVRLGQDAWDYDVKEFLKSRSHSCYSVNRIREVSKHKILTYCGMDSLVEWHVAMDQRKEFGLHEIDD